MARVAAVGLAAAFLLGAVAAGALWRVALRGSTGDRASHEAAVRAVPGNVADRQALAHLDVAAGRPRAARARLSAALRRAPFAAPLWLDRADVALALGDPPAARRDALRAVHLAPADAAGCERAAVVLLQADGAADAAPLLRCAATLRPEREPAVLDLAAAVYPDVGAVLRTVVPPDANGVGRFLRWAHERDRVGAAALGWRALAALGPSRGDRLRHVDFLLDHGLVDDAGALWAEAYGAAGPGRVFDGGFETDPVGAGFGWILSERNGARIAITRDAAASGRSGLSVEFQGGNVAFFGVRQVVPVEGGRRYRLSALVRTDGVTSLSGPRLRVEAHPACRGFSTVESAELRGTRPWGPVGVEFTTPPDCRGVRILLCRPATDRLDRELRGRVQLDDVALRDLGAPS